MLFDINKPNRLAIRGKLSASLASVNTINAKNVVHALATLFDSEICQTKAPSVIEIIFIKEIKSNEIDAF